MSNKGFCRTALAKPGLLITHYNGCHVQLFSCPGLAITNAFESGVICDQIHGHTLGEYPFHCSLYTPQLLSNLKMYNSGDKPCTFNLSLHQKTKEKGQNNCNKSGRVESTG